MSLQFGPSKVGPPSRGGLNERSNLSGYSAVTVPLGSRHLPAGNVR